MPTGSPAWGAISRIRRPVTALSAERGASEVALVEPRSSSVPQSASGTWTFGLAVTGVPEHDETGDRRGADVAGRAGRSLRRRLRGR